MYVIDKNKNSLMALEATRLSQVGFKERAHIQEWVAATPSCLGEELLIIQKEFDGFDDTRERLDLLALDKEGQLVLIENKLDDSGKDVTWQSLKYAAYCSSLTKDDVVRIAQDYFDSEGIEQRAEIAIATFLGVEELEGVQINEGASQRVFMIATHMRKEVTATALWLTNFGLDIRCFKISPFLFQDNVLLSVEQIIPVPEAEDYMIGISKKQREEDKTRTTKRIVDGKKKAFWTNLLKSFSEQGVTDFANTKATERGFISKSSKMEASTFEVKIKRDKIQVELYINSGDEARSMEIFEALRAYEDEIHATFGQPLNWEENEGSTTAFVYFDRPADYTDEESWDDVFVWAGEHYTLLRKAIDPAIAKANKVLSKKR